MNKSFFIAIIIIIFTFFVPVKLNQDNIVKSHAISSQYDEMLVSATSDAAKQLIYTIDSYSNENVAEGEKIDYRDINLNLDKALDRFYGTLFINMNIEENYSYQQAIKYRIPIKIVTGYEGYYINYFKADGKGEEWSELKPYSLVDGDLVIHFTLDDTVYVTDPITQKTKTGKRKDFETKYPTSCLKDQKTFNEVRNQVINNMIQNDLEYYTKQANAIAQQYNWSIRFDIPYWGNKAIDSVSFLAFYQGDGFVGANKVFNSYGFSTTKTIKNKNIYGYIKNGKKLYSNEKKENIELVYFENEYEAAENGYEPDLEYYYNIK